MPGGCGTGTLDNWIPDCGTTPRAPRLLKTRYISTLPGTRLGIFPTFLCNLFDWPLPTTILNGHADIHYLNHLLWIPMKSWILFTVSEILNWIPISEFVYNSSDEWEMTEKMPQADEYLITSTLICRNQYILFDIKISRKYEISQQVTTSNCSQNKYLHMLGRYLLSFQHQFTPPTYLLPTIKAPTNKNSLHNSQIFDNIYLEAIIKLN